MSHELFKRYRPKKLKSLIGQEAAIASLSKLVEAKKIPHAILLSGPSGSGKTTIARILKTELNCGDHDFQEMNCADFRGIEDVRDIRRQMGFRPISGDSRIWLMDEIHRTTTDAQNSLLKMLEDTPDHVYFILATTDPQKLLKTILTRCTEIKLKALTNAALLTLIGRVAEKESIAISDDVANEIAEAAEGSGRKALVILEQIAQLGTDEEKLAGIKISSAAKTQAIELARELFAFKPSWAKAAAILKELNEEPESIRYLVLGYARSVLLGGGALSERAFKVIEIFGNNFYDSKSAGLAAACWEVLHG